jgi:two-component system chemotaxis sensor kinase CheA
LDDLLRDFLTETAENLDLVDVELVRFEQEPDNAKILGNIFRLVHTVKGTCGFLGLPRLEALAHAAETLMGKFRSGAVATADAVTLILAAIDRIKELLADLERCGVEPDGDDQDLVSELERAAVLAEAGPKAATAGETNALGRELRPGEVSLEELERAFQAAPGPDLPKPAPKPAAPAAAVGGASEEKSESAIAGQTIRVGVDTLDRLMTMVSELVLTRNQLMDTVRKHGDSGFGLPLQRLSHVTAELQEGVMKTRMQPIGAAWRALPRLVRDLASDLGKKIELVTSGADAELDRQVLDLIKDPLTHMVRNCADHGLETPAERLAAGKPEIGTIRLQAFHQGGYVIVEIADDGRGLDVERIKRKAIANGLATAAEIEKMPEPQILRFIFAPGFSTAEKVTSVSGRGVGMDVVRSNIEQIGGSIDLRSTFGKGSAVVIRIPLTLAIIPALMVKAGAEIFAIPQLAVLELVHARPGGEQRIERIGDAALLRLRERLLPLVKLGGLLGLDGTRDDDAFIIVAQAGDEAFGIVVDDVLHTEEIVVKPMVSRLKEIALFAGTTILGDGSVILILDPNGVAQAIGPSAAREARLAKAEDERDPSDVGSVVPLLLFRAGSAAPKAAPLALVTRLEMIDVRTVEIADGRMLAQYRGALMPLIPAGEGVRLKEEGDQPLLVFCDDGRSVGLIVDEILDIVEQRIEIGVSSVASGTLGTAVIAGAATEILDVAHYLTLAFDDWLRRKDRPTENGSQPTVMLVDDSAFFRNMLTPVLTAAGYRVTPVDSGAAALDLIQRGRRYDIVVSDIEMPEMDGFAFAEALLAEPLAAGVPILALSSLAASNVVQRARQAGFSDYVAKFDRPGLIEALKVHAPGYRNAA